MIGLEPASLRHSLSPALRSAAQYLASGNLQSARDQATLALEQSHPTAQQLFAAHYFLLQARQQLADDEAVRHGLTLLSLADTINDNEYRALAHSEIGDLYRQLGMVHRSVRHLRESLRYASSTAAAQLALPFLRLGLAYLTIGQHSDALVRLERARNLFFSLNQTAMAARALLGEAEALTSLARAEEALSRLETAENLILQTDDRKRLTAVHRALASAYGVLGDDEQVADNLSLAVALHEQGIDSHCEAQTRLELARFRFSKGQLDAALASLRTALHLFRASGDLAGQAEVLRLMASVHEAAGEATAALGALKEHLDLRLKLEARDGDRSAAVRIMQLEQSLAHEHSSGRRTHRALVEANRILREQSVQLEELSRTDYLTRLFNRRHLTQLLEREQKATSQGQSLSLLLFDVDDFKNINDSLGHLVGDKVLKGIGSILLELAHDNRVMARWGGEEFAVALLGMNEQATAEFAELLRERIAGHDWAVIDEGLSELPISISAGIACMSEPEVDTVRQLIHLADNRMYEAKELGRNRVVNIG